jgi:hypothetical protein
VIQDEDAVAFFFAYHRKNVTGVAYIYLLAVSLNGHLNKKPHRQALLPCFEIKKSKI